MFPHTVTLYNKYVVAGTEKWARTVLRGVFWDSSKGAVVRKTGIANADGLRLIVPCTVSARGVYIKPEAWKAKTSKIGYWTLRPGDLLVLGSVDYEVTTSTKELLQFDDVMTITNVDTRDFGGGMSHWEVTGR